MASSRIQRLFNSCRQQRGHKNRSREISIMNTVSSATVVAHPNIALAKYWGKLPDSDNAPAVPSLSITLSGLSTQTTVRFDAELTEDHVLFNGEQAQGKNRSRLVQLLDRVRAYSQQRTFARVTTVNDFPTSAGLASSASGFAALALAASHAMGLECDRAWASDLARRCSASAARSLYGGFVELLAGDHRHKKDPTTPLFATQIANEEHLPCRVLVLVTTQATKDISSTIGMNHTAQTSPYYQSWVQSAPAMFQSIKQAVLRRDMQALGEMAEHSALAMHACAIAANPGVMYWNGTTIDLIHHLRALRKQGTPAWFTIDAGPHVKVLTTPTDAPELKQKLSEHPGVLRVLETQPGPGAHLVHASETEVLS
jgi:diphosphomevalonate decarboxylase